MIDPRLAGRTVLITGANNPEGIGAAMARAFAAQGARVFLTYLRLQPEDDAGDPGTPSMEHQARLNARTAADVVAEIRESGGSAEACEADLSRPGTVAELFGRAEARLGPVTVLVHNAAAYTPDTFVPGGDGEAVTAESHDLHFAVNSRATALLIAEFARRHVARGAAWGRVITVSTDGSSAFAGAVSYGASKHALESYSRAAALELGRFGITVNVVSPGPTQTGWIPPRDERALAAEIPLRRIGEPDDIAEVAVLLASEQARWITGQLLYAGGGHVMPQ